MIISIIVLGFSVLVIVAFIIFIFLYFSLQRIQTTHKETTPTVEDVPISPPTPSPQVHQPHPHVIRLQKILEKQRNKPTHKTVLSQMPQHHKIHLQDSLRHIVESRVQKRKKEEYDSHIQHLKDTFSQSKKKKAFARLKELQKR